MKKITMTFSVFVEDDAKTFDLYEHICEWEGNIHGTVEVQYEHEEENAVIGE